MINHKISTNLNITVEIHFDDRPAYQGIKNTQPSESSDIEVTRVTWNGYEIADLLTNDDYATILREIMKSRSK